MGISVQRSEFSHSVSLASDCWDQVEAGKGYKGSDGDDDDGEAPDAVLCSLGGPQATGTAHVGFSIIVEMLGAIEFSAYGNFILSTNNIPCSSQASCPNHHIL